MGVQRNVSWGRNVLLVCCVVLVAALPPGCRQSAGPVHGLAIDPDRVASISFDALDPFPFILEDRGLIARVVEEINGLSFTPYRPPITLRVIPEVVIKDENGQTIVELCIRSADSITFWEPDSEPFHVKKDNLMVTTGRLFAYSAFMESMRSLELYACQSSWDEIDQRMAPFGWDSWVKEVYPEPYRSWPTPQTPQELAERLKALPEMSLEDLEKFPNYFE